MPLVKQSRRRRPSHWIASGCALAMTRGLAAMTRGLAAMTGGLLAMTGCSCWFVRLVAESSLR
ncbi:MAG: hypothetical protein LBT00_00045 [Spirochaetaceae bacterium]|nr:hypothetical protein [Spirochaetaceae bacterium]